MSHQYSALWARYEQCVRRTRRAHELGVAAPYAWADYRTAKRELEDFVLGNPEYEETFELMVQIINRK